jgi:hypothetical protein
MNWDDILPPETDDEFYSSMNFQIDFVRHSLPSIEPIRAIAAIFRISNTTYYQMFSPRHRHPAPQLSSLPVAKPGRPPLLSEDLEARLLDHIGESQDRCDCLSPRKCREWLSQELSTGTRAVIIDRFWWRRLLARHPELAVRRCDSREAARAQLSRDHITPYLDALADMLSHECHPDLIINMDESRFTTRPAKGTQKNWIFSRNCPIKPRFLERQDANHVALVGAVTLSGSALIPFLLSTRVQLPDEIASSSIVGEFRYFHTKKGYLTGLAMDYSVQTVLLPCINATRSRLQGRITAVLVLDGLRSHSTADTRDIFQREQIRVIELPSYATHLYQPLDLFLFGLAKKEYRRSVNNDTHFGEKISRKRERILKAWYRACYRGNISAAWKSGGFVHVFVDGTTVGIAINPTFMALKLAQ